MSQRFKVAKPFSVFAGKNTPKLFFISAGAKFFVSKGGEEVVCSVITSKLHLYSICEASPLTHGYPPSTVKHLDPLSVKVTFFPSPGLSGLYIKEGKGLAPTGVPNDVALLLSKVELLSTHESAKTHAGEVKNKNAKTNIKNFIFIVLFYNVPSVPYKGSITDTAKKATTTPKKIISIGSNKAVKVATALFTSFW